jgi:hypothetical protein
LNHPFNGLTYGEWLNQHNHGWVIEMYHDERVKRNQQQSGVQQGEAPVSAAILPEYLLQPQPAPSAPPIWEIDFTLDGGYVAEQDINNDNNAPAQNYYRK